MDKHQGYGLTDKEMSMTPEQRQKKADRLEAEAAAHFAQANALRAEIERRRAARRKAMRLIEHERDGKL